MTRTVVMSRYSLVKKHSRERCLEREKSLDMLAEVTLLQSHSGAVAEAALGKSPYRPSTLPWSSAHCKAEELRATEATKAKASAGALTLVLLLLTLSMIKMRVTRF